MVWTLTIDDRPRAGGDAGRPRIWLAMIAAATLLAAGCGDAGASTASRTPRGVVEVVAAENFWGSIASQVGGAHVHVTSIITAPNSDPHAYEPTAADARAVALADVVIVNGVGYDPWASRLLAVDPRHRLVLDVGAVAGVSRGGNPHRWYNPTDVQKVITTYVDDLSRVDRPDMVYFRTQQFHYNHVSLSAYDSLVIQIRDEFAGTRVGASESIFAMLAPALGLDLITPVSFLREISEGTDVSAADKATIDTQIRTGQIAIYVYNRQNATPDVLEQVGEARARHIPTATITETLAPAAVTFQEWQTLQLQGILAALRKATAR